MTNRKPEHRLAVGAANSGKFISAKEETSLVTIAPSGSGKSQCQVIPNLLFWEYSAVVLDVKGELYKATAKRRRKFGKVYKFDIFDTSGNGNKFNPFQFIRTDFEHLWDDAGFLASMMLLPQPASDPYWQRAAKNVIHGILAAMVLDSISLKKKQGTAGPRSIDYVLDALADRKILEKVADTLCSYKAEIKPAWRVGCQLRDLIQKDEDTNSNMLHSILSQASISLYDLGGKLVENATSGCDWTPETLRKERSTVYITLQSGRVEEFAALLRLVLGIHLRHYLEKLPDESCEPILFMLDELPQLKKMQPVLDALDLGRQYRIVTWAFAQTMNQLTESYGDADDFLSRCHIQCFMNPSMMDGLAQKLSEALGKTTSLVKGESDKPKVDAVDLAGSEYQNKIIMFAQGKDHIILNKRFAYNDTSLQNFMSGRMP